MLAEVGRNLQYNGDIALVMQKTNNHLAHNYAKPTIFLVIIRCYIC